MHRNVLIVLTGIFICTNINGQNFEQADSLFSMAGEAYADEKFDVSINLYENILEQGLESAETYFNLANAYYKTRNYPRAILNYERALRLDPLNENIRFNLEKARVYNVDRIDEIPEIIVKRSLRNLVEFFRPNTWAIISLSSFLAGLICFLIYFLSMKMVLKRLGFYTGLFAILLAISTFFIAGSAKKLMVESNGAIVLTPTVTVKGSPSESSTDLFIIHEGTKVYIQDYLDNWYEIKIADGKQGWLKESDVELI